MALTYTLRKAASRVVPLAARAFRGTSRCNYHHSSALLAAVNSSSHPSEVLSRRVFPSAPRFFSARPASDETLVQVLKDEITYAEESDENVNKAAELPPNFPFKLEDNPGQQTVTLTGEYQGEQITVEVHMPSAITGDYAEKDEDDNDDDVEKAETSQLPIVVRVSKNNVPCLEFGCTAEPDMITIDSLSVKDPNGGEDQLAYEGPDFNDLDENLQKAFHKYLEIRGIKPSTTNFFFEYMLNKDGKEYLRWLKNLKKFVEV